MEVIDGSIMLRKLRAYVQKHESMSAAARCLGISPSYLFEMLRKRRNISVAVAEHLGYTKRTIVQYEQRADDAVLVCGEDGT